VAAEVIDVHAHVVFEALNNTAGNYGPEAGVDQTGAPFFRIGGYTMKPISYQGTVFTDLDLRIAHLDRLASIFRCSPPIPSLSFMALSPPSPLTFASDTTN
jgi:hypothetical protein